MAFRAALGLLLASSAIARRGARVPRDLDEQFFVNRLAVEEPSENINTPEISEHVVRLERGNGSSLSSLYVNAIRAQANGENPAYSRLQVYPTVSLEYFQLTMDAFRQGT